MNEALQDRADRIQRELDRREASRSTSDRQAAYLTSRGRNAEPDDDEARDDVDTWGDDGERQSSGDRASRRQASRITRGGSRRRS